MRTPHVVIIGGGFGGLAAAQALKRAPVTVTLIDRRNHHLFQPLLYQVATAALAAPDIAAPLRQILRRQENVTVLNDEVRSIDVVSRTIETRSERLQYDFLVIASGASHSYFGHDDWAGDAPGLKTLEQALDLRRRVWIQHALEFVVQVARAKRAPQHGGQHLHISHGIEAERAWDAICYDLDQLGDPDLWVIDLDEIEVRLLTGAGPFWHLA